MRLKDLFRFNLNEAQHDVLDVCGTTVIVNPSPGDVAKTLTKEKTLRALAEPGRFVVWPSDEALHQPVQIALKMSDRARRYFVMGNSHATDRTLTQIGRYYVYVMDSSNSVVKALNMSKEMLSALNVKLRR